MAKKLAQDKWRSGLIQMIIIVFACILISGCNAAKNSNATEKDTTSPTALAQQWQTFEDNQNKIAFQYPSTWRKIDLSNPNALFGAVGPVDQFNYSPYIFLIKSQSSEYAITAEEQAKVDEMYNRNPDNWTKAGGKANYILVSFTPIDISGSKSGFIDCEYMDVEERVMIRERKLVVPVFKTSYNLIMGCSKESWGQNEPIFSEVVKSFKFIP